MSSQVNRAILLWENWQDKQAMLEDVFGRAFLLTSVSRSMKKTTAKQETKAGTISAN